MCIVASTALIIMAAASAAGAAYSAYAANQQENAMEDAIKVNREQTNEAAAAQTNDQRRQARSMRATARAAAAQAGASGNSVTAMLNDISMQEGMNTARIEKNRVNAINSQASMGEIQLGRIQTQETSSIISSIGSMAGAYNSYAGGNIPKIPIGGAVAAPTMDTSFQIDPSQINLVPVNKVTL